LAAKVLAVRPLSLLVRFDSQPELWRVVAENDAVAALRADERTIEVDAVARVEVPVKPALVTMPQLPAL
jgi:hypothetical protein